MIKRKEDIMCMAKIVEDLAYEPSSGPIDKFIYFSPVNSSHGPRIKFYGGTSMTSTTQKAPSYGFDKNGPTDKILKDWMNNKNCPNAFNDKYLEYVRNFISINLPILQLVWHNHLDEGLALGYFHGQLAYEKLLTKIDYVEEYPEILECKDKEELHNFCIKNNLYRF